MSKRWRASLPASSNSRMMEHTLHLPCLSRWHKKLPPAILRSQLTLKVYVCVRVRALGGGGRLYFVSQTQYLITGMTTVLTEEEKIDNDKSDFLFCYLGRIAPACLRLQHWSTPPTLVFADGYGKHIDHQACTGFKFKSVNCNWPTMTVSRSKREKSPNLQGRRGQLQVTGCT